MMEDELLAGASDGVPQGLFRIFVSKITTINYRHN